MEEKKEVCKFCCSGDNREFLTQINIDLGILGEDYEMTNVIIDRNRESDQAHYIQLAITDSRGDLLFTNSRIFYCPVCGRKLETKKEEKENE